MSTRHSISAVAILATLVCASSHAALMQDPHGNLNLAPEWIEVFVDEFEGTSPTTWGTRDGDIMPYDQASTWLGMPFGQLSGRETFWVPRSQPTFYLEGFNPPFPDPQADRGLTFHNLDVEAVGNANYVTIDPSPTPGQFTYISSAGTRDVTLTVMARTPEPASSLLAVVAFAGFGLVRRRS
jgi:hypothetical protein